MAVFNKYSYEYNCIVYDGKVSTSMVRVTPWSTKFKYSIQIAEIVLECVCYPLETGDYHNADLIVFLWSSNC